jgi:diaminohydroxyphosphoribosylaminopyrimidine deaminase/5-amino-6-(5-phosphoribosylamino)uracil reductase
MNKTGSREIERWMRGALTLARRGEALASPNPMVGAVLVRGGRMIGEGFHTYDGIRHAEIIALAAAGKAARGATLYINFEPCCHTGRTPPCTDALIAAGVARVIAAMPDPSPAVAGRGFRRLRAAGIKVEVAAQFTDEARRLNEAFACWITSRRPFVTLKSALTMDGSLVLPPRKGAPRENHPRWITSQASRDEVQRMRHASDALLTGIGTVLADDPLLTDRTGLPRRRRLLRVVLDSRLRLSPRSRLARSSDGDILVITGAGFSRARERKLRSMGIEVISVPGASGHPSLRKVLDELGSRGILSVLLEAGPTLNRAARQLDLVDKVRLFYAPIRAGGNGPRELPPPLKNVHMAQFGPDVSIEGYLHDVYRR